jgi:hypothetical protein
MLNQIFKFIWSFYECIVKIPINQVLSYTVILQNCSLWLFVLVISSNAKFYVVTFCPVTFCPVTFRPWLFVCDFLSCDFLSYIRLYNGIRWNKTLYFLCRSCSILFTCFVLVASIVSFCVISVSPCFLTYDFLDYHFGLVLLCIRLPMSYICIGTIQVLFLFLCHGVKL